ncbi:hypothetical protein KG088_18330 [Halomonas sp. TRM85114]|uniref:hypothetical protein n=1 Tax=Halomonas jincaotanensis TaxID=2810616 RepID=UPI001BD616EE|nr:hypothetical protein [Halomonas jincaotanensis]MBS9405557.1 hypothetical protein [Halomonas jincaotanensis]
MIAGDGIREGITGMAELITRNASLGFSFGLVEVALYQFGEQGLVVQPRVVARTETIERTLVHVKEGSGGILQEFMDDADSEVTPLTMMEDRAWWEPLTRISFDDPEQESPSYRPHNHVKVQLPYSGIWITAFRSKGKGNCGVFLTGKQLELPPPPISSTGSTRSDRRFWPSFPAATLNVLR